MTTVAAKVLYAVEDESERSDVNVWSRLNARPNVPSLDEIPSVDAVAVVSTAFVLVTEAAVAVRVGAPVESADDALIPGK